MNAFTILILCLAPAAALVVPTDTKLKATPSKLANFSAEEALTAEEGLTSYTEADIDAIDFDKLEELYMTKAIEQFTPSEHLVSAWTTKKNKEVKLRDAATKESLIPETCKKDVSRKSMKQPECADPWPVEHNCRQAYEVPNYRLGDLFFKNWDWPANIAFTKFYFPQSIATKYWKAKTHSSEDYDALIKILDSPEYADYERPSNDTVVIHFRGYDVLTLYSIVGGYTRPDRYYGKMAKNAAALGLKKAVILTGDHWLSQYAALHGRSAEDDPDTRKAMERTKAQLEMISKEFEKEGISVTMRQNWNADCDLVYMASAKTFVPSGGSFDKMISGVIAKKGGTNLLGQSIKDRLTGSGASGPAIKRVAENNHLPAEAITPSK